MEEKMTITEIIGREIDRYLDSSYPRCSDGFYHYALYADYNDELSCKFVCKILKSKSPREAFQDSLFEAYQFVIDGCECELCDEISHHLYKCDALDVHVDANELTEIIMTYIQDNVIFDLPEEHYLKQTFCVNIMTDTGDGNYDYVLNAIYPCWYGRYEDTIDEKSSLLWLAKQQGYLKSEFHKAMREGDIANPKGFLQTCRQELANLTSHMSTLTFLAEMTLEQIIELNELIKLQDRNGIHYDATKNPYCGYIVIDKSAETGLYDPWLGGGSTLEIELEKDVKLPIKYIRSALPDGGDGYSIESVYCLNHSCWRDVVKTIHAPTKGDNK